MTFATIGLSAGFVFVVVLLLALCLRTAYPWPLKVGVIILAGAFYLFVLEALPNFYGWPTKQPLPEKFFLLDAHVDEPRNAADEGAVFLWVDSLLDDEVRPRSYELPYSEELHTRVTAAQGRMEFGQTLAGEVEPAASGSGGQKGAMPRFFFMEKPRPPKQQE